MVFTLWTVLASSKHSTMRRTPSFGNLRRSAIPDEDVQFPYRAGIADPELEITIYDRISKKKDRLRA